MRASPGGPRRKRARLKRHPCQRCGRPTLPGLEYDSDPDSGGVCYRCLGRSESPPHASGLESVEATPEVWAVDGSAGRRYYQPPSGSS